MPCSAALRCGLIEATEKPFDVRAEAEGVPQHYAAASLKPSAACDIDRAGFSVPQHYAAASLKHLMEIHLAAITDVFRSITLRPH